MQWNAKAKKGIEEAERRIEKARRSGAAELDLSHLDLTELPDDIGQLKRLRVLDLNFNKLTSFSDSIGRLKQLQVLTAINSRLTALPDAIGKLKKLELLKLNGNAITALPAAIGDFTELRDLDLTGNRLEKLTDAIGKLKQLHILGLGHNKLKSLPKAVGALKELQELWLWENQLNALPDAVFNLKQLRKLSVARNHICVLPTEISELKELEVLDFGDNRITALPESLARLTKLQGLYPHGNKALGIPPEILGPSWLRVIVHQESAAKPADILAYYFKSRKEATRRLNEAKILLVGQGGVGKTSLVKRLVHDEYDEHEAKTEGINIERWVVPGRSIDGDKPEPVRLNIWDFGGQEIMHATHQFFLTKRSLYLLLIDARQGEIEGNIHYWLRIIQSYGGDAPVLIVTNKIEAHPLDLNETRLKKDYAPNVQGFFKISCATGAGIDDLREAIETHVNALPHVRDKLPVSYFTIKEKLEAEAQSRNYLDAEDYHELCAANGVTDSAEQDRLLRFLHDLGGVLNFDDSDNPLAIHDTKILNPEWVTDGVYKILNDLELAKDDGELELARLKRILLAKDGYPTQRHAFIIGMMRKFDLCFEFPDSKPKRLLIPELLPEKEPDLNWNTEDALNFQYHYSVLPDGLISRFIVRMHHNLTTSPTYWRSGVLLEIDGNRSLVRADKETKRVFISVAGSNIVHARRRALTVIRDAFKVIHNSIPRLEAAQKVPLPDNPDVVADYEHLITLEENNIDTFLPEGAKKKYNVRDLLEGIEDRQPFDVFLSHNSKDKETVREIAQLLKEKGLNVWLDEEQLVPGRPWQEALEGVIKTAKTAAVLVGKDGLGPWEEPEMRGCLSQCVKRNMPVIPTLLPGAPCEPELPLFLENLAWVDIRGVLADDSLDKLRWGITAKKL